MAMDRELGAFGAGTGAATGALMGYLVGSVTKIV